MKKLLFALLFLVVSVTALYSVPATPYLITTTQPDGSELSYYLRGDEHFSFMQTEDGYLLAVSDQGVYEYARISGNREIVPVGIKASNIESRTAIEKQYLLTALKVEDLRSQLAALKDNALSTISLMKNAPQPNPVGNPKAFPLQGSPKSIVILVNFADVKFTSPTAQQDFTRLLNEEGYSENGGTGSARDYFVASSNGAFTPNFVVVGPYDLSRNYSYYGAPSGNNYDSKPGEMIIDACKAADKDIDFAEYDTDNNGTIDNVFVYYAGYNQAEGADDNTIWPHRSTLRSSEVFDGKYVRDYACTSEFRGNGGKRMCGIGTFCHEFGHVLSLPDLYVTDYNSSHPTPGWWDIMDHGSYNNNGCTPPTYSSYERFFLGWLTPTLLSEDKFCSLEPLESTNTAYIVSSTGKHNLSGSAPSPTEFFMLENRQRVGGPVYSGVPAEGLLITRINYSASDWSNNSPNNNKDRQGVEIMCAAGSTDNPGRNVFPGTDNVTKYKFTLRDGTVLERELTEISETGDIVSFMYGIDLYATRIQLVEGSIPDFVSYFEKENQVRTIQLKGTNIKERVSIAPLKSSRSDFKIRLHTDDDSEKFSSSVYVTAEADSTFDIKLDIQFAPSALSYDEYITDDLYIGCGDLKLQFPMRGQSKVPYRIFTPHLYDATDVSPFSFQATWQKVDGASAYLISAYTVSNAESSEVENFSTFEKEAPKGWTANFNTVQRQYTGSTPCAAYFTSSADTLITCKYYMPASRITFWIHAMNSVGTLYVDAENADGTWTNVSTTACDATTRSKTVAVKMDEEKYSRFKIYYTPTSGSGGLAFDDFTVYHSSTVSYAYQDQEVPSTDTTFSVSNLAGGTTYKCVVKAYQTDAEKNYEYTSDPSNEIEVTTLQGSADDIERVLSITRHADGTYRAFVPAFTENGALFIYNTDGDLVVEIPATSNEFIIPRLVNGEIYVLKYAERGNQKRKTPVGKLFYIE